MLTFLRVFVVVLVAAAAVSSFAADPKPAAARKPPPVKSAPAEKKPPQVELRPVPEVECRWATGPIVIDGRADEPAWAAAQVVESFTTPWLPGEPKPTTPWKARILWDGQYLYFQADMVDGDLYGEMTEHDAATWENDVFELFVKPEVERPQYYEFQVNPANTKFDMFVPERNVGAFFDNVKRDPFAWETAVVLRGTLDNRRDRDEGWSCEGRIPWADFIHTGARPKVDEVWRFAFCRYDYDLTKDRPNLTTNARFTRPDFHQHENYAPLRFVGPPETGPKPYGLSARVPLTSSKVVGAPEPPPPYRAVRAFPKLKLNHLLMIRHQPGTDKLWCLAQLDGGGKTALLRFTDDPEVTEYERLHDFTSIAYDFTFHPRFAENGYVYVGWNSAPGDDQIPKSCRIWRLTFDHQKQKIVEGSEVPIIEWPSAGHDGCALVFGNDGMLYVTTGDGSSDSDEYLSGQDMSRLLAKLLRIDVDHVRPEDKAAGKMYSVPPDNPFVGMNDCRPETWAYGFRNPWRMAVDRATGHLWVTQNGQDLYEQVYFIRKGENYGWSVMEGSQPFYAERKRGPTPIVPPTVEHGHHEARSLTGGIVYTGTKYPELRGTYNYADYSTGKIWIVRHDGVKVTESREIADTTLSISAISADSKGELLVCDYKPKDESAAYYLEPTPPAPPSNFPRKLSESGLFQTKADGSLVGHQVVPGVVPYTVNSPLWSDNAYKERFVAVPGDGKVTANPGARSWNFPDGTVLIKSFALETEAGNPKSRQWIETRFLLKQENEWIGYSYEWNDRQTDAMLVDKKGLDKKFSIRDAQAAGGVRSQTWHYPSRAECMICHSRAANFVLGLSTPQLNCDFDYGDVTDNQLRTWSQIGMFEKPLEIDWSALVIRAAREAGFEPKEANAYWARILKERKDRRALAARPTVDVDFASFEKLADPADETAPIEARARSYLHANCSHCHVDAGGGNSQFRLGVQFPLSESKLLGVAPLHATYGIKDPKLVAKGEPERSMVFHRLEKQDRGRMPPIAVSLPDRLGIDVVRRWIASLPKPPKTTRVDPE